MPDQDRSYFTRSWALLTSQRGWLKPVLVLAVSMFVPIAGMLGVQGYALEWARLTAWGVDAAPKQRDVRVGECIASGWRALLASAGYSIGGGLLASFLLNLIGQNVVSDILSMLLTPAISTIAALAALRATIYQQTLAGYQLHRMWDMIQRDPAGLAKVALILLLGTMGISVIVGLLGLFALFPMMISLFAGIESSGLMYVDVLGASDMRVLFYEVADALAAMAPWLAVVAFVMFVGSVILSLVSYNALALWMRQFDVPAWGASDDPLPAVVTPGAGAARYGAGYGAGYGSPQASGPYSQQMPQQMPQQTYTQQGNQVPQQVPQGQDVAPSSVPMPIPTPIPSPQSGASTAHDAVESMNVAVEPTESSQVEGLREETIATEVIPLTPTEVIAAPTETTTPTVAKTNAWFEAAQSQQKADREQRGDV